MIDTTTQATRRQDQTNVRMIRTILQLIDRLTDPRSARELSARLRRASR